MKVQKNKNNRKLFIVLALVVALAALGAAWYIYHRNSSTRSSANTPTPTKSDRPNKPLGDVNYDKPTTDQSQASGVADPKPADPTPVTPSTTPISVYFSAANQNGDTLQMRLSITGVYSQGSCDLTFEKSGQTTIRQSVGLFALPNSTTCKGFDIPTANLAKGDWKATVKVSADGRSGTAEKVVKVQ